MEGLNAKSEDKPPKESGNKDKEDSTSKTVLEDEEPVLVKILFVSVDRDFLSSVETIESMKTGV